MRERGRRRPRCASRSGCWPKSGGCGWCWRMARCRTVRSPMTAAPRACSPWRSLQGDPETLLHDARRRRRLDEALSSFVAEQREVFVLYELEGFSLPEIAQALQVPVGTATSRLRRARTSFEAWIAAQRGPSCPRARSACQIRSRATPASATTARSPTAPKSAAPSCVDDECRIAHYACFTSQYVDCHDGGCFATSVCADQWP